MRIDKRKGLNEVTQQGSHSSQHVIFSSELSSYIMRVYTKSIHCCSLNLIPSILVQLSTRNNITFEWEMYILAKYLLLFYIFVSTIKNLLNESIKRNILLLELKLSFIKFHWQFTFYAYIFCVLTKLPTSKACISL